MKPLISAACIAAAFVLSPAAFAQDKAAAGYPAKPIRMIVPFAAGGGLDITARLIGQKLTDKWGQSIVVDTRPGAATIVGTEIADNTRLSTPIAVSAPCSASAFMTVASMPM